MDVKDLQFIPPWDWPRDAGETLKAILTDPRADQSDRLVAADLAGDLVVMNDEIADSLLAIINNPDEPERLRAVAAIGLGPALEQTETDSYDDPDEAPLSQGMFRNIQDLFQKLYFDNSTPKEVRRRVLEASVRATESWHQEAIRTAYSSGDRDWILTAVFSMRWVRGFEDQILESLKSADTDIRYEAIQAAGNWEMAPAWSHIKAILRDARAPKPLRLAAIEAAANVSPDEAPRILSDLGDSKDEEIAEAAQEALGMAAALSIKEEDEEGEGDWVN